MIDLNILFISLLISIIFSVIFAKFVIKQSHKIGRNLLKDKNVKGDPLVAGMGGTALLFGFIFGVFTIITYNTVLLGTVASISLFAIISTIIITAMIGIFDDLFEIPQKIKMFLPMIAAIPLIAINAGDTIMTLPLIGTIDFGIIYLLLLIPLAVTVVSNLTNMLAGFSGNEGTMGIIIFITLSIISVLIGNLEILYVTIPLIGGLIGLLYFNLHPAKIFPGDIGTFIIGGAIASIVIVYNMETIGVILMIPYMIDFVLKARKGMPKTYVNPDANGRLYPPKGEIRGLIDLILVSGKGLTIRQVILSTALIQTMFGIIAIAYILMR